MAEVAKEHGIEVLTPRRPSEPEFLHRLTDLAPDCCPVVAYGALVPKAALEIPLHGWINLHFSLLPAWRGAAPVQHSVMAGDEITGASTFQLETGLDTGPIYGVVTETVRPRDTAGDLLGRLADSGATLLLATLDAIESGEAHPQPQPDEGISMAPKLTVDDARVDWALPAVAIDRRIRGCTPAPGAWTTFHQQRVRLGPVEPTTEDSLAPGAIEVRRRDVLVGTATAPIRLGDVQPPGKRMMPATDWARGVRPAEDERFE